MNVCAICHAPATGFVNVNASAASSVPSAFEARCDAHNPYRFDLTAIPTPARSPMPVSEADDDSAGATTRGGQRCTGPGKARQAPHRGGSSTARTASVSGDTVPHVVAGCPDPSIR
jgi:hypothetical protein